MHSAVKGISFFPGLYIHIPFCLSRCHYCSFASNLFDSSQMTRYLIALEKELSVQKEKLAHGISTIFIGGGTPSVLTVQQWDRLLSLLSRQPPADEFTIEVNPDSLSREKLILFRQHGVNRLSVGVQTFNPQGLQLLGRRHNAGTAKEAVQEAIKQGFDSVSLDLIAAWPGQTLAILEKDIKTAIALGVTHLSCYNLIIEEETVIYQDFVSGKLKEISENEARDFWDTGLQILKESGFEHYEISNFAKVGKRCKHNVNCWEGHDYIGIGAAAHSHWRGRRFANHAPLAAYLECMEQNRSPECFSECLDPEAKAREGATLWLRMAEGIDVDDFTARFGISLFGLYGRKLENLLNQGILERKAGIGGREFIGLSKDAYPVADLVLVDLV